MQFSASVRLLGLAAVLFFNIQNSRAAQKNPVKEKSDPKPATPINQKNKSQKYSFHEASSLSGIILKPDRTSGNTLLSFDQRLHEPGMVLVKNSTGKVLFSNLLQPTTEPITHTMNIGKLIPGMYSIEVKTAETTFWKKVRVRK